ncbi:glycoside hydrolase family protein [Carboxylicivirga sediminis]|uniref:Glycoside hydrolase family protein n=1 Tax=Carboxylicivirga sediminis TaxID=2006564 RepID=A0A941F278_9BACT|nr:glycoside hydrolase family protein [Carboxylicivirga sediminis]MBR8534020.1 glycoside hydrolase family protein [Carboxylicivirga sediminis]
MRALTLCITLLLLIACSSKKRNTDDLDFSKLLLPVDQQNILYDSTENFNWGASIVKGEDGKYHAFYSQMRRKYGFKSWLTDGVISHAVADSPAGPYMHLNTVLEGRGPDYWDPYTVHNPWIQKYGDNYYLYYISTNLNNQTLSTDEYDQARHQWIDNKYRALVRENQRIGLAFSKSVYGPWERLNSPIVEPAGPIETITCNPAVTQRPDGGFLMLVRGDKPNVNELVRSQAIALSDKPEGPWKIQPIAAVGDLNAEDPAVWYDKHRNRYYGIYHAFGYLGLITSEDGLNWQKAKHYKVSDLEYQHKDGRTIKVARMERPFVYLENDKPKVLSVSIKLDNGESYSLFIPLKQS